METLYIVIGAFSSIFIFLLGYAVSGVFNGKKRMDGLDSFIEDTDRRLSEIDRELNEKIDRNVDVLVNNIGALDKDVYAHIDSRLDKLENPKYFLTFATQSMCLMIAAMKLFSSDQLSQLNSSNQKFCSKSCKKKTVMTAFLR